MKKSETTLEKEPSNCHHETLPQENKAAHFRNVIISISVFVLLQSLAAWFGSVRTTQYYVRIFFLIEINIILTVSLALINGLTGQFSLGHAGFMAIGAYGSVIITTILPRFMGFSPFSVDSFWGHAAFLLSILCGAILSGLIGFMIGFPSLRLRGDYLAIVTLAAGEVIRALLRFFDFAGGPRGVPGIPRFANAFYLGAALIGTLWLIRNFAFSHFGRVCISVRNDEIAAKCMGINTTLVKTMAFVLGAAFAGIGGALYAHMSRYINPDNFTLLKSLDILIFLYVGGAKTLSGGILGAALFTLIPEILRLVNLESWRMIVYPVILILVMRFKQNGLLGDREFGILIPWKFKQMKLQREKYDSFQHK